MRKAITAFLALSMTGCLAGNLRVPVEDHHVQTRVIAETCKAGGYGVACPDDLVDDLKAMQAQACALDAIVKKTDASECKPAEAGK